MKTVAETMRTIHIAGVLVGLSLIAVAVYIFSLPAGAATVGEVRGIAGLCGLLIGGGLGLIGLTIAFGAPRTTTKTRGGR